MNTLEQQRQRLMREMHQAEIQLSIIKRKSYPELKLLYEYQDQILRNRNLIAMIDQHLQQNIGLNGSRASETR